MKVLVGLSGGVDSAVAAYILKKKGYDGIEAGPLSNYIREYFDKTQQELADVLNVSRSTYAGWENGIDTIPLVCLSLLVNPLLVNSPLIL